MSSYKTENNIERFENRISSAIVALLSVALLITTVLFTIISYQSYLHQKSIKFKEIDSAISLFRYNLSEKLSIIASSNIFLDFYNSGASTREDLESKFLTELLPLSSNGIIGYSLTNSQTSTDYKSGQQSKKFLSIKLCYLANKLDSENGNCYGTLKLFFSEGNIYSQLSRINNAIIACSSCSKYNLTKNGYFGNFLVDGQSQFDTKITIDSKHDNIIYYYIIIIIILLSFAHFNRARIRKIIKETISKPIDSMIQKIKSHEPMSDDPEALQEINYLSSQIEEGRIHEKQSAVGYLAAGVAHDIRSPLAVMEITLSKVSSVIPDLQFSILNQAIQSVRDIANNLLEHHQELTNKINLTDNSRKLAIDNGNIARPILLTPLIEFMTSQKKYEWQSNPCELQLYIDPKAKSAWVFAAPNDIKRIISNLLNNAYESLTVLRNISITIELLDNNISVKIQDSGHGIPESKIRDVLAGTSLKHKGNGFGLFNAKKYLENLHGTLKLSSSLSEGTLVMLSFVLHQKPTWYPDSIKVPTNGIVVIVDDDPTMHNLWRHRLQAFNLTIKHFSNSHSFFAWRASNKNFQTEVIYLIDYDLRAENINGLQIFVKLFNESHRYLITSHADEILIQEKCQTSRIWLIPKALAGDIVIDILII